MRCRGSVFFSSATNLIELFNSSQTHKMSGPTSMISHKIEKNRIVTKLQQAFHPDSSPYQQLDFSQQVKDACSQNKTGTVGLRICKAVLVGDVAVGKSCLVNRFCHDIFDRDYKATIGVDFEVEKFSILSVPFNLQIWDTAGQERFKCIAASYYRGAHLVLVVFDLSDIQSLMHCKMWRDDACENADDPIVFLIGTKKDLVSPSAYEDIEAKAVKVAQEINAEYWAVSSKTGEFVKDFFFRVVGLTFDRAVMREAQTHGVKSRQIGSGLVKINKPREDLYETKSSKAKCCK